MDATPHDLGLLCALVDSAGGSVYQVKRLEVAAYLLSRGARRIRDGLRMDRPFSFRFAKFSHAAMADDHLRDAIDLLVFLRLVTETAEEDRRGTGVLHGMIQLTDRGRELAERSSASLSSGDRVRLGEVGWLLGDPGIRPGDILRRYCPRWIAEVEHVVGTITAPGRLRSSRRWRSFGRYLLLLPWRPGPEPLDRIASSIPFLIRDNRSALTLAAPVTVGPRGLGARFQVDWEMLDDYQSGPAGIAPLRRLREVLRQLSVDARLQVLPQGLLRWELVPGIGGRGFNDRSRFAFGIMEEATLHTLGRAPPLVGVLRTGPRDGEGALTPDLLVPRAWPRCYRAPSEGGSISGDLEATYRAWLKKVRFFAKLGPHLDKLSETRTRVLTERYLDRAADLRLRRTSAGERIERGLEQLQGTLIRMGGRPPA